MRVALIQTALHWEQPDANLKMLSGKIQLLSGKSDLIALPEMFTTGFSMQAPALADVLEGKTLHWMQEQATLSGAAITGSFICKTETGFFNRLLFVKPGGDYAFYDKRHAFALAGEHEVYGVGNNHLTVEWKGWRIRPLICYDLRFPVWARQPADIANHYDLLLYVANWPEKRIHQWSALLRARAIENQAYTLGLNITGQDGNGHSYSGDSAILDYAGYTLCTASQVEHILQAELHLEQQQQYRKQFPFLADADNFEIKY